jgi:uncharacterized LabA/DUF88 family protein
MAAFSHSKGLKLRTIVYIDGFNLYYRMLKKSKFKWLNLHALCQSVMPSSQQIVAVNYYTARVSGRIDPRAPARQQAYFNALNTLPTLSIHQGRFQVHDTDMFLATPLEFRPSVTSIIPTPKFAKVVKTEEKGSDVNLGVHIVRDGFQKKYDHAVVLTNDTDLEEPLRIVQNDLGLPVTLLSPVAKPAASLVKQCSGIIHLTQGHLRASQFPATFQNSAGKTISKPATW